MRAKVLWPWEPDEDGDEDEPDPMVFRDTFYPCFWITCDAIFHLTSPS